MTNKSIKLVPAIVTGVSILRCIGRSKEPLGVAQLSQTLGINPSTCFNILKTYAHLGWLEFDAASKRYSLALGMLEVASGLLNRGAIPLIRPKIRELSTEYGATLLLWRRTGEFRLTLVDKAEPANAVRVQLVVGQRFPALLGAVGRSFAAKMDLTRDKLQAQFAHLRWNSPPDFEQYVQEVELAKTTGFGRETGSFQVGVNGVGVVMSGQNGAPSMGLSALWVGEILSHDRAEELGQRLKDLALELERSSLLPNYEPA